MDSVFAFLRTPRHSAHPCNPVKQGRDASACLSACLSALPNAPSQLSGLRFPFELKLPATRHPKCFPVPTPIPIPTPSLTFAPLHAAPPQLHLCTVCPISRCHPPPETLASTFAPLHRSPAPICTFALSSPDSPALQPSCPPFRLWPTGQLFNRSTNQPCLSGVSSRSLSSGF